MIAKQSVPTRGALQDHDECTTGVYEQGKKKNVQHGIETASAVHLHYVATVLTVTKNSLVHHITLLSSFRFITETKTLSSIYFTFGTLFHLAYTSLASPKRPLTLHMPVAPPKIHSPPTTMPKASRNTNLQLTNVGKPTLSSPNAPAYPAYPGCLARRHSFSIPSSSPRDHLLPLPPNTSNKRSTGRRHSIGLTAPDNHGGTPFPATTMYAKIVSHLETNLECKRHFYHLQRFNNCFFGQRMVNCLLAYCITSLNSCMTKDKAIEMCNRLLDHNVIEDVSHRKRPGTTFKCNRLYRFTGKHFWEDTCNTIPELDGVATSTSMPSLSFSKTSRHSSNRRSLRALSIKTMYSTIQERKTNFVRSCRSRLSQKIIISTI